MKRISLVGVNSGQLIGTTAIGSFAEFLSKKNLLERRDTEAPDSLTCVDYSARVGFRLRQLGLEPAKCCLVRMEPSVVLPANFARSRKSQFKKIITVGGFSSQDSISVHWPLLWPSTSELQKFHGTERAERAVVVNGNKMSFIKGELYSLRRKAIRNLGSLDLYGTQWDSKFASRLIIALKSFAQAVLSLKLPRFSGLNLWFQNYPKSKGPVDDKLKTMANYKYALVIENSAEYMSEKLMEALFAGCIPIYVGPDPEKYSIPKELVIRAEPNVHSIKNGLAEAKSWKIEEFHARLAEFLSSSEVRDLWDHERVYERMLLEIQKSNK